jgi:hypothetical protein
VERRLAAPDVDVVAVEGDVDGADVDLHPAPLLDQATQAVRERDAARVDADERHVLQRLVPLDDLVRDPRERPLDRVGIEEDLPGQARADGGVAAHLTPSRPRWTELKVVVRGAAYRGRRTH